VSELEAEQDQENQDGRQLVNESVVVADRGYGRGDEERQEHHDDDAPGDGQQAVCGALVD
jgi:hypothetical protein